MQNTSAKTSRSSKIRHAAGWMLFTAFMAGASPAVLNFAVDPYGVFGEAAKGTSGEIAEKAHYPLYKLAAYRPGKFDTIILGDSRARALRDKYWHELGRPAARNLAYGGATIPEIHSTFMAIKDDPSLRTIVIGIQLRSFDEDHKGGMNRVPEALRISGSKIEYLKNWFVSKIAWRVLENDHPQIAQARGTLGRAVAGMLGGDANASEKPGARKIEALADPQNCEGCDLPDTAIQAPASAPGGAVQGGYGFDDQRWNSLYAVNVAPRQLPEKIARQIIKGGRNDWDGFEVSERYWAMLAEISNIAKTTGKQLVFVVPPTIVELQKTITDHRQGAENHRFRERLATLGTVLDFDYQSAITEEPANFTDAYHFNSRVAKMIVGETILTLDGNSTTAAKALKRRSEMLCPVSGAKATAPISTSLAIVTGGTACRVWRARENG